MRLHIYLPAGCPAERTYCAFVLFREFLGIDPILHLTDQTGETRIAADDGKELVVHDRFFPLADGDWLGTSMLRHLRVHRIPLSSLPFPVRSPYSDLPLLFSTTGEASDHPITATSARVECNVDIFGACFFLLSRYEEAVRPERDRLDRFPFKASVLSSQDLVERPLVNEYLEVLWSCLVHLWPGLERRRRAYQFLLTHDVDRPLSMSHVGAGMAAAKAGAALLVRRSPSLAMRRLKAYLRGTRGDYADDPCNTFDLMMSVAEDHRLRTAYYFITAHRAGPIDGAYHLSDPWIRALLRSIHERGHEIGIHGSFTTYKDVAQLSHEVALLKTACLEEGVPVGSIGGRQHYLRWSALDTWDIWDQVGLSYDSTVGFAEHSGFRAGTCFEFPVYSLRHRRQLGLRERPLVVMEVSLTSRQYMSLSIPDAMLRARRLIGVCRFYEGCFTCLFHNSSLETTADKRFFLDMVAAAS